MKEEIATSKRSPGDIAHERAEQVEAKRIVECHRREEAERAERKKALAEEKSRIEEQLAREGEKK